MSEPQKPNWWQTLPGVLTALAATITALSGLAAILFQNGVFGAKAEAKAGNPPITQVTTTDGPGASAGVSAAAAPHRAPPADSVGSASSAQAGKTARPWSEAEAVLLGRDGTVTRIRASSLSNCISANHELSLDNGQSIAFEKLAGFDVVQADDHANSNAKAKLRLILANGTEISGTVEANCDLFGTNDIGRVTTYYDQLRGVRFE